MLRPCAGAFCLRPLPPLLAPACLRAPPLREPPPCPCAPLVAGGKAERAPPPEPPLGLEAIAHLPSGRRARTEMAAAKAMEAKHEKMIRAMQREPFNKKCFTCEALGPQYVCA